MEETLNIGSVVSNGTSAPSSTASPAVIEIPFINFDLT